MFYTALDDKWRLVDDDNNVLPFDTVMEACGILYPLLDYDRFFRLAYADKGNFDELEEELLSTVYNNGVIVIPSFVDVV